jgi:hypothetical protein
VGCFRYLSVSSNSKKNHKAYDMTKEQELFLCFSNEIIRPWEDLNRELSKDCSVSPQYSLLTNKAHALATSLKHISEANGGPKSKELNNLSESYYIISDLADTKKTWKKRQS